MPVSFSRSYEKCFFFVVVVCLLFLAVALLSPSCDIKETFSLELTVAKQYVMSQWEKRDEAGC